MILYFNVLFTIFEDIIFRKSKLFKLDFKISRLEMCCISFCIYLLRIFFVEQPKIYSLRAPTLLFVANNLFSYIFTPIYPKLIISLRLLEFNQIPCIKTAPCTAPTQYRFSGGAKVTGASWQPKASYLPTFGSVKKSALQLKVPFGSCWGCRPISPPLYRLMLVNNW